MRTGDHARFVRLLARALAYHRAPATHAKQMINDPIMPTEFALLFRLASGAPLEKFGLEEDRVRDPRELRAAALDYIQLVLFREGADHYRILGLLPPASVLELKEHHRLLMRLMHPDRGVTGAKWRHAYASRVNQAYNALSIAMSAVDEYRPSHGPASDHTVWEGVSNIGQGGAHAAHSLYEQRQSRRTRRILAFVALSVGVAVALILALVYFDAAPKGTTSFKVLENGPVASPAPPCPDPGQAAAQGQPGDMASQVQHALEARLCEALPASAENPGETARGRR